MKKINIIILVLLFVMLLTPNINSLKIMEPVFKDLEFDNSVEIGNIIINEFFLISFLNEDVNYKDIKVIEENKNNVIIDNIKKTNESIFATLKINKKTKDNKIKLKLISENKTKQIVLNYNISKKPIIPFLREYNKNIKFSSKQEIKLTLINNTISTQKIKISSDLSDYWFNKNIKKTQNYSLQPRETKKVSYKFIANEIGDNNFDLFVYSKNNLERTINIKTTVKKDLKGIYDSRKHSFPLFNFNSVPIYYFNKILKII